MAAAYFIAHAPQNFFPVNNGGDAAILYCFVFLYLADRRARRVERRRKPQAGMKIALIGATGLIGRQLWPLLEARHDLLVLGRRPSGAEREKLGADGGVAGAARR
jgi:hypothetical protein